MSDELLEIDVDDLAVSRTKAATSWLPPSNRQWIIRYALGMTAITNLVIGGLLAWLTSIGHRHLDLGGVPLIAAPNLITDTLGTFVILPLTTAVLCSLGVRGFLSRGLIEPIRLPALAGPHLLDRLPNRDVRAGLVLAAWTTALLGPGACVLLVAVSSSGMSRGSFVLYKVLLGVALGAVITPLVALRAMSEVSVSKSQVFASEVS